MTNLFNKKRSYLVDSIMIFFLLISFLIFEAVKTLSEILTYGIFKKEVLTTKSNLGVDLKIKIR